MHWVETSLAPEGQGWSVEKLAAMELRLRAAPREGAASRAMSQAAHANARGHVHVEAWAVHVNLQVYPMHVPCRTAASTPPVSLDCLP
jgi:hypothetical protein